MTDKHSDAGTQGAVETSVSGTQDIERTEHLVAGETYIGRIRRARLKDGTLLNNVPVYYGNAAFLEDGSRLHMAPETYRKMLSIFLTESSRGKHFLIPSEEESEIACRICMREENAEEPAKPSDVKVETSVEEAPSGEEQKPAMAEPQGQKESPKTLMEESAAHSKAPESDSKESESPKDAKEEEKSYDFGITENAQTEPEKQIDADPDAEQGVEQEAPESGDQEDTHREVKPRKEVKNQPLHAERKSHGGHEDRGLKAALVVLLSLCIVLLLVMADVIPNPFDGFQNATVNVAALANDVSKGEAITEADLTSMVIPWSQLELINEPDTVDASGSVTSGSAVLWSSRSSVIGKYASAELHAGDVLLSSDCVLFRNSTTMMELNVDEKTVYIPASALDPSKAEVKLYAIVTSSDAESRQSSYAVDLGTLKLSGESLEDILNAEGKSVLETIQGN